MLSKNLSEYCFEVQVLLHLFLIMHLPPEVKYLNFGQSHLSVSPLYKEVL